MKIDYKYTQILEDIMRYGYVYEDPNRKDVFRKELETVHIKHLVQEGFPIVTARKTFFKGAVGELLLFLKGSTDIRDYHNYGIKFWDKDTKNYEGKLSKYPISEYQKWCENNKKFIIKKQRISKFSHPVQLKTDSEVFENRNGEQYIILEKLKKGRLSYLKIQFLNGGFIKEIRNSKNKKLSVQNPYQISKLGVGCFGNINLENDVDKYIYRVWSNMLKRCYEKSNINYENYGKKGVFVNEKWLCFEFFYKDFKKYKNFSNDLSTLKNYQLDKDFNGDGYEYSFEKCDLILVSKNISGVRGVVFEFENIETGEIVFTDNIWKFVKERKLGKSAESSFYWLLNGKLKTCKKWKCNSCSPIKYDMGKIYAYQYKKQHSVFDNFKENPLRTDLIIDSWQVDDLKDMCLIPCFLKDSKIKTISGEYKNIQDIKKGDLVLTKEGDYKPVYETMINDYYDDIYKIRVHGSPFSINATKEHPFWTNKKEWVNAKDLKKGDYLAIPLNKENKIPEILTKNKVNQHFTKSQLIKLDKKEQWFLMGYFLGDGWLSKNKIILSINDKQFEEVNNSIKEVFKIKKIEQNKNCSKYVVSNKEYFDIFKSFGKGAKNKLIPDFVQNAPKEFIEEFLNGYFYADGCNVGFNKKATTISDNIAFGVQMLCCKIGKRLSLYYQNRTSKKIIEGREVKQQNTYSLDLKDITINKTENYFFDEDFAWFKINSIEIEKLKTKVYNLSVKDSHTYTVNNIVTHNCHYSFQIVGSDDGFLIVWNQRSTDFLLGTPINIQFYFLMGMLLELWSGHKFNGVVGNLCKVHLYDNQLKLASEMIKLPTSLYKEGVVVKLELEEDLKDLPFSEFIKKIEPSNFKIEDYDFVINESVEMLTYKK